MRVAGGRARRCPGCGTPVPTRSARWCGRCGDPLRAPAPTAGDRARSGRRWPQHAATGVVAVAVVAAVVAVGGPVVDRLPAADRAGEVVAPTARTLDRVQGRARPEAATVTTPVCLRTPGTDCFRWTLATARFGRHTATVVDERVLVLAPGSEVTALDLADGAPLWRAPSDGAATFLATAELILLPGADGLVARSTRDGRHRWTNPELDARRHHGAVVQADGHVLLTMEGRRIDDGTGGGAGNAAEGMRIGTRVVALEADSGEVAWQRDVDGAVSLGPDGSAVLLDTDGALVALAPDGSERWRVPGAVPPDGEGDAWTVGRHIAVWSVGPDGAAPLERLHRLTDGRDLGIDGWVLASDHRHTLVASRGDAVSAITGLVLLDRDDQVVWRSDPERSGCLAQASLAPEVVFVRTCGAEEQELLLDRADGTVLDRVVDDRDGHSAHAGVVAVDGRSWPVGPYLLRPEGSEEGAAWELVDRRDGAPLARLPAGSRPVLAGSGPTLRTVADRIAVVRHGNGLVAVDLPAGRPQDATADGREGARTGDHEERG